MGRYLRLRPGINVSIYDISGLTGTAYSKRIAYRGIWVEPTLLAEVEYRAKSAEGKVRHPVFKGLREDL
jgi:ATP-dependent DNA ligase